MKIKYSFKNGSWVVVTNHNPAELAEMTAMSRQYNERPQAELLRGEERVGPRVMDVYAFVARLRDGRYLTPDGGSTSDIRWAAVISGRQQMEELEYLAALCVLELVEIKYAYKPAK